MEEKVAELAPPDISSPEQGEKVHKLFFKGFGIAGAQILMRSNFLRPDPSGSQWIPITEVKQDKTWEFSTSDYNSEHPRELYCAVMQRLHWPPGESPPSETVYFTKLLGPPQVTIPIPGGALDPFEQTIEGTGYKLASVLEVELNAVPPLPPDRYVANATIDNIGWWKATPKWSLTSGPYLLKCRQGNNDHTSPWSDEIAVIVK